MNESKGGMTVLQEIIATDFNGNIPTKEEIITKFPPKEETFTIGNKEKTTFPRMVSRSSRGTILYAVPPKAA